MSGDYISREAAISKLRLVEIREASINFPAAMLSELKSIPAADVVEVVRCRECRYAYDTVCGWCCSHGICVDCIVGEDFFCADGKRKDGGHDDGD